MAKTDYQSIDEYNAAFPAEAVERMESIRKVIHEVVPEAEEVISSRSHVSSTKVT